MLTCRTLGGSGCSMVLSRPNLRKRHEALTSGPIWRFGWGANSGDPYRYWHADFPPTAGGSGDCQIDLSTSPELSPLAELWSIAEGAGMAGKRCSEHTQKAYIRL